MTARNLPPAVLLMGPTASGKTALALELVESGPFEIISVDSGMVYRGMDIGTAKPDAATLARAPHRLIDLCEPTEAYSAARFRADALAAMAEIAAAGRIPLLVGGTMLYFRALLEGLAAMPDADPDIRARLEAEGREQGWPALHARLAEVDPASAARLKPNDSQRLQRALEVYELTGKPLSAWHAEQDVAPPPPYAFLKLALAPADRAVLHARIADRFDAMLKEGLLDEVATLRARGDLHPGLPSMRAVGYRQAWSHLDGETTQEAFREQGIAATRQLAKRQLTWLRSFPGITWMQHPDTDLVKKRLNSGASDATLASPGAS